MLEGGDGTGGVGEGGLEMGEDLGRGSVLRRHFGRRAASEESGAEVALGVVESLPEALQGPVAEMAVEAAKGGEEAVGDGNLEEAPQVGGGQCEASDFVGEPDGEGPSAAGPSVAVAAKDASGGEGLSLRAALVKTVQKAVLNESADNLAVRTRGQFESLGNGGPFFGVAVKPSLLAHLACSAKKSDYTGTGKGGVAGYEKDPRNGVRGKTAGDIAKFWV